jgi:hypothetical protein
VCFIHPMLRESRQLVQKLLWGQTQATTDAKARTS